MNEVYGHGAEAPVVPTNMNQNNVVTYGNGPFKQFTIEEFSLKEPIPIADLPSQK